MKKQYLILFIIVCLFSCNNQDKEHKIKVLDDKCYMVNSNDTMMIGDIRLKKALFQSLNTDLLSIIQNKEFDEFNPSEEETLMDNSITGVYINSKIFDCFELKNGTINKIDNSFDILFIYPEMSRYNFQFSHSLGYRVLHYLGFLYQEPSCNQNLPYYVQNIIKRDDNSFLMTYSDKTTCLNLNDKEDSLIFSTYPKIKIEFSNKNLEGFQQSKEYFKLSDEIIKEVYITIPANTLPQDINELYIREIVTQIINIKFNTKLKTKDIVGTLD
jgi:hypothetical protein